MRCFGWNLKKLFEIQFLFEIKLYETFSSCIALSQVVFSPVPDPTFEVKSSSNIAITIFWEFDEVVETNIEVLNNVFRFITCWCIDFINVYYAIESP